MMFGIAWRMALLALFVSPAPIAAQGGPSAAAGDATLTGVVIDKSTGDPIIEAGVEVVGRNITVRTDLDGRYSIKVPPGTHELRFYAPLYQGARIQAVTVGAGKTTKTDVSLAPTGQAGVDVVEVVAQADRAAEATQLVKRKQAPVVSETISAEAIKKSPASDAAEVVQRAPAVTVRDDRFIFVRGLNERYTTAMVNGSRLPSTDPERRVVPLDLFPAEFLESLSILKSYTPDHPGDYAGGLVDLQLRDYPERLTAGLSASASANTQATFKDFDTYHGSSYDPFGFGKTFRQIPAGVPDSRRFQSLSQERQDTLGRRFRNIWDVDEESAPPGAGGSVVFGDSWGPFGLQLGGTYSNEYKRRTEIVRQYINAGSLDAPEISARDDFTTDVSQFQTRLGAILTSAYKLTDAHKLTFRSFLNHGSTDEVLSSVGTHNNLNPEDLQRQVRLRYTEEQLALGQLGGEHRFPWVQLDWRTAFSRTTQDEPDMRHTTYVGPPGRPPTFTEDSSGGVRLYNELEEILTDSAVDFTIPFRTALPFTEVWSGLPAKFKWGLAYAFRDRDFRQRRFRYVPTPAAVDTTLGPEDLFAPENLSPGVVDFIEQTAPDDTFAATQEIAAAYGMFELPILRDRLRFVGGVRTEYSLIRLETFDELGNEARPRKKNVDPLPGVNLIYSPRHDMNVRAGWSRTVARPEFRELSPVVYPAPRGLRPLIGNPDLVQTAIESWDLRWEWFFSPLELVSLSFFYKKLDQPIELVTISQSSNIADSFDNAEEGEITGAEFELRKDFGFLSGPLKRLSFLTNVTYAESTVTARRGAFQLQTNLERDLQGQAPYIVNGGLDYTHPRWGTARLLYSTAARRIASVGSFGLPDIFEERRDQLDAVYVLPLKDVVGVPLSLKLVGENLLNDQVLLTQGGETQQRYITGVKFGIGLSYAF